MTCIAMNFCWIRGASLSMASTKTNLLSKFLTFQNDWLNEGTHKMWPIFNGDQIVNQICAQLADCRWSFYWSILAVSIPNRLIAVLIIRLQNEAIKMMAWIFIRLTVTCRIMGCSLHSFDLSQNLMSRNIECLM